MCNDPYAPLQAALRATKHALTELRRQQFTGTLWVTWQAGVCVGVHSEGSSVFGEPPGVLWVDRLDVAQRQIAAVGVLRAGRVRLDWRDGLPGRPVVVPEQTLDTVVCPAL